MESFKEKEGRFKERLEDLAQQLQTSQTQIQNIANDIEQKRKALNEL
jgi:prefoldin subunit 5